MAAGAAAASAARVATAAVPAPSSDCEGSGGVGERGGGGGGNATAGWSSGRSGRQGGGCGSGLGTAAAQQDEPVASAAHAAAGAGREAVSRAVASLVISAGCGAVSGVLCDRRQSGGSGWAAGLTGGRSSCSAGRSGDKQGGGGGGCGGRGARGSLVGGGVVFTGGYTRHRRGRKASPRLKGTVGSGERGSAHSFSLRKGGGVSGGSKCNAVGADNGRWGQAGQTNAPGACDGHIRQGEAQGGGQGQRRGAGAGAKGGAGVE
jgi:hypothetical protein